MHQNIFCIFYVSYSIYFIFEGKQTVNNNFLKIEGRAEKKNFSSVNIVFFKIHYFLIPLPKQHLKVYYD